MITRPDVPCRERTRSRSSQAGDGRSEDAIQPGDRTAAARLAAEAGRRRSCADPEHASHHQRPLVAGRAVAGTGGAVRSVPGGPSRRHYRTCRSSMPTTRSGSASISPATTLDQQLDYWKQQLAGAPPTLDLPTDQAAAGDREFLGRSLPAALARRSRQRSARAEPHVTARRSS